MGNFIFQSFRLLIDNKIYLATLCDLPNIIEGQKTLDFRTFYKSVDVSQILYIHNKSMDDVQQKSPEELLKFAKDFNPVLEDQDFFNNLYRKSETKKMVEDQRAKGEEIKYDCLKFRHGLAPVSKNIRNIRHKKEPNENQDEVHAVEQILKDIIDYGFADNVEEELLEFDDNGNLVNCIKGAKEKRKENQTSNLIQLDIFGDVSAKSESNYQNMMFEQSSLYSGQVEQFDDATSQQQTLYNDQANDYNDYPQQNYPQIQFSGSQKQNPNQQEEQKIMINTYSSHQQQQQTSPGQISINLASGQQQRQQSHSQFYQDQQNQQQNYQGNNNIQFQQQIQQQDQQQFNQYSEIDYQNMRRDFKEIKKLIKQTKNDINDAQSQGYEIQQLKDYYRNLLAQKQQLRELKKEAKRQLKQRGL